MPSDCIQTDTVPLFKSDKNIMESLLKDVITAHINQYSLITSSQHDFLLGRYYLVRVYRILNINQGVPVDSLCLDFSYVSRVPQ